MEPLYILPTLVDEDILHNTILICERLLNRSQIEKIRATYLNAEITAISMKQRLSEEIGERSVVFKRAHE